MPAGQSEAADASVKVTLPNFTVKLNGHAVENQYREYPLLVYRGITYFPMTWNDTRLLGLEANWSQAAGLNITQSKVTSSYEAYKTEKRNAATYSATIAASAIKVNGKVIDNNKEQYPLLTFRNITYFPLTWRFAHDEFGWDYKWSSASGLSISSHNTQLQAVGLPAKAADHDVALFKGYYYYTQTTDKTFSVYRAPVTQPSAKEEVYSYKIEGTDPEWLPQNIDFQIRDQELWFSYHVGGGLTGSDMFVEIDDKGKSEIVYQNDVDFRSTPFGDLIVYFGTRAFEGGNLYLTSAGEKTQIGDPKLMYAVTLSGKSWSLGSGGHSYIDVVGDQAYVLASRDTSDANKIYAINLKTNQMTKIVDSGVTELKATDDQLLYVKVTDQLLYSSNFEGTNETKLSEQAVTWFDSIDGQVFYTTKKSSAQYELYKANPNGQDTLAWSSPFVNVQVINNQLVGDLGGNSGIVILDHSGQLALKVAEPIKQILTSDEGVLVQRSKDSSIALIR